MSNSADSFSLTGLRADGRRCGELRRLASKIAVMNRAGVVDGSSYLEQGLNKVLVTVHGPDEPAHGGQGQDGVGAIRCRIVNASFSGLEHKRRRMGDRRNAELEQIVEDAMASVILLELYPQSEIIIVVHVLESDGSVLPAMINASSLACMEAGVMMKDIVTACSVGIINGKVCSDLNQLEEASCKAHFPVAVKSSSKEVVFMQMDRQMSLEALQNALAAAVQGCAEVRAFLEERVKQHVAEALGAC